MTPPNVGDMLETRGVIDSGQAYDLTQDAVHNGKDILQLVLDYGIFATEDEFWAVVAEELGADHFDLTTYEPPPSVINLSPSGMARLYGAFPITLDGRGLHVAFTDPLNPQVVEDLRFGLGKAVVPVVARRTQVQALIDKHYGTTSPSIDDIFGGLSAVGKESPEIEANSAPIVKFVDLVMAQAIKEKASDIHFEPFEHEFKIRYRVDGALYEMAPPPVHLANSVISRIKVMSSMNIAERRVPQDGRIKVQMLGKELDLRVSSIPTMYGESVVIRLLDKENTVLDFAGLGFAGRHLQQFIDVLSQPHGIILITGPTGSGKSTTMYAALKQLNTPERKIITVEDPVEYQMEGVNQIQAKPQIGLTFASALRSIVRQDPDVIMIGEMRDLETARIAVQSALTGHLVLSTLHTNDAAGGITRLLDMGLEEYLLTSTVNGILAQRLVRKLCPVCKTGAIADPEIVKELRLQRFAPEGDIILYKPVGCSACAGMGYRGRLAIIEFLPMTDPIRKLIMTHEEAGAIQKLAVAEGMQTLYENGLVKVIQGITTLEEVMRVTTED